MLPQVADRVIRNSPVEIARAFCSLRIANEMMVTDWVIGQGEAPVGC